MPQFFIDRPVFAWVVALFIMLAGALAIPQLPVAKYPDVAPPQVEVYAIYPGASAQTLDESVVSLIEQELNGTDGLLYFESQSSLGSASITATFKPGTDPEMAQVDVQNRLKAVESRLPQAVIQQGLQVEKISSREARFAPREESTSSAISAERSACPCICPMPASSSVKQSGLPLSCSRIASRSVSVGGIWGSARRVCSHTS